MQGFQSDVFSLGCIFYFVLTSGQHPFGRPMERTFRILHNLSDCMQSSLDVKWKELTSRMTSLNSDSRPSAEELLTSECFKSATSSLYNPYEPKTQMQPFSPNNINLPGDNKSWECILTSLSEHLQLPAEWKSRLQVNPNATNENGNTVLMVAALNCAPLTTLRDLIAAGIKPNVKNGPGQTILHFLSMAGNYEAMKYFVSTGMKINLKDRSGNVPIHFVPKTKQHFAETINTLVNLQADINATNFNGESLVLLAACQGRSKDELQHIVRHGGNWKLKTKEGKSVLHFAVKNGKFKTIRYFAGLGLNVDDKDCSGNTPLHYSIYTKRNFRQVLNALVDNNGNINATDEEDRNIMLLAAINGRCKEDLQFIVELGGNWNLKTRCGKTVVHFAVKNGMYRTIRYFAGLGANLNEKDKSGSTPFHMICYNKQNFRQVLNVLLENGADINAENNEGENVLFVAAKEGRAKNELELLFRSGARWNERAKIERSILDVLEPTKNYDALKNLKSIKQ